MEFYQWILIIGLPIGVMVGGLVGGEIARQRWVARMKVLRGRHGP